MPSVREVAKTAGVSTATVSRVINGSDTVKEDLRQRVLKAVEVCKYEPTVGRREKTAIALMYPEGVWISSPYDSASIEGMMAALEETPYDLLVLDPKRAKLENETFQQFLSRKGVCGVVVRSTSASRGLLSSWAEEGIPVVLLGDHFEGPNLTSVYASSADASRDAVEYLVSLGHKRIAFAACERDDGDHLDRLQAYKQVMESAGLLDPSLILRIPPYRLDGLQLMRNIMGMANRPTAIYIADPLVAIGALNEAHRMQVRIPEELSLIGFDDCETRGLVYPQMSAVCQDARELGKAAIACVLARLEGCQPRTSRKEDGEEQEGASSINRAWLDIGHTTGAPPQEVRRIMPNGARV